MSIAQLLLPQPVKNSSSRACLPTRRSKRGDPGFIRLDQVGGAGVVEGAGLVLRDPDADQIAAQVVPLRQTMQGLASEELLGDLALERDAVGSMLPCHGSSSENPAPRSISELPTCPAPGAHSSAGSICPAQSALRRRAPAYWLCKAATHAQLGQLDEARAAIAEALKLDPTLTLQGEREGRLALGLAPACAEHLTAALRKAGLPKGAAP